jgi:hypothetical protein
LGPGEGRLIVHDAQVRSYEGVGQAGGHQLIVEAADRCMLLKACELRQRAAAASKRCPDRQHDAVVWPLIVVVLLDRRSSAFPGDVRDARKIGHGSPNDAVRRFDPQVRRLVQQPTIGVRRR